MKRLRFRPNQTTIFGTTVFFCLAAITGAQVPLNPSAGEAARFLTQSTFGPTNSLIAKVQSQGLPVFLSQQFATPATATLPRVNQAIAGLPRGTIPTYSPFQEAWWHTIVTAPDQLRQRVAFALSEIMVVSANSNSVYNHPEGLAVYWDLLARDAFGNFRTLLEDVTLNPSMGDFLDMVHNDKPDPVRNIEPNENFARELMQVFTIGLYQLNQDGTNKLDQNNRPIPTFDQDVVEGYAHVFTGWYWFQSRNPTWGMEAKLNYLQPMMAFPDHHDTGPKTLLNGVVLAAGRSQAQDLKDGLDLLFYHRNTGPFIARRLIQRLVTSNPSPPYISRVAAVFANNGAGVRGDLKAVVQAILLDPEARSSNWVANPRYGREREPIIRLANLYRAFNGSASSGRFVFTNLMFNFGQAPLYSPSVFNFFRPDYSPVGPIGQAKLFAPEFQITTDTTVITSANQIFGTIYQDAATAGPKTIVLDLSPLTAIAANPAALLDSLNNLLMAGEMSIETRNIVLNAVTQIPATRVLDRARTAVTLLVTSPEFVIQK